MKRVIVILLLGALAQGCGDAGPGDPLAGDTAEHTPLDDAGAPGADPAPGTPGESPGSTGSPGESTTTPPGPFADCAQGCAYRLAAFTPEGSHLSASDPSGAAIAQTLSPLAGPSATDGTFTLHMGTPAGGEQ